MKKFPVIVSTVGLLALALGFWVLVVRKGDQMRSQDTVNQMNVVTTIYPLTEFTRQVGGDLITTMSVIPTGVEPHDFEPSPQQIAQIYDAKLFVFNGSGIEPWAEDLKNDLIKKGVTVVEMTDHFELLEHEDHEDEGADEEDHSEYDPHIWLDPVLAQQQVEVIRDTLVQIDPDHQAEYTANAAAYIMQLSDLNAEYAAGLQSCSLRDVVVSHAAFGYLAKRYGIEMLPVAGLSPEAEPSPKQIAAVTEFVREKGVKYVFYETLVSPSVAQTIAKEAGVNTLVFNPLEGLTEEEATAGESYLSLMQSNLTNLRTALECQ